MFYKTVSYEGNQKYWLANLAILKSDKHTKNFSGYLLLLGPRPDDA
jgi:hypothetical protein